MSDKNLVSIIIVNLNGKKYLEKCLETLVKVDHPSYEIILVDNNSTDDSVEFVKNSYPSVIIIKLEKNYGFAEPNNIGAKNAKGKFLLFLNNDTTVHPKFVTEMINVFKKDKKIAICQSLLLKPNDEIDSSGDFVDTLGRAYSSRVLLTKDKEILSARGASMMVRKDLFWELSGFDKEFFASYEDVDLGWKAWIWGYKVVLATNSIVYHKGKQTIQNLSSEVRFHSVKNTLVLRLVNFETSLAISSTFKSFFIVFMRKFFGVSVVSDPEESPPLPSTSTIFKSAWWVIKNLKYVSTKRKKVNSRRIRTTKDLLSKNLITKVQR